MTAPAAGWYVNPEGPGMRWWDGVQWTQHTAVEAPPAAPTYPQAPAYPTAAPVFTAPYQATPNPYQAVAVANKKATTALTLALVSLIVNPFMVLSILAIVFGAQGQTEATALQQAGHGRIGGKQASWAIGIGILGCVVFVIVVSGYLANH